MVAKELKEETSDCHKVCDEIEWIEVIELSGSERKVGCRPDFRSLVRS
jgi:hypothetical protein